MSEKKKIFIFDYSIETFKNKKYLKIVLKIIYIFKLFNVRMEFNTNLISLALSSFVFFYISTFTSYFPSNFLRNNQNLGN